MFKVEVELNWRKFHINRPNNKTAVLTLGGKASLIAAFVKTTMLLESSLPPDGSPCKYDVRYDFQYEITTIYEAFTLKTHFIHLSPDEAQMLEHIYRQILPIAEVNKMVQGINYIAKGKEQEIAEGLFPGFKTGYRSPETVVIDILRAQYPTYHWDSLEHPHFNIDAVATDIDKWAVEKGIS